MRTTDSETDHAVAARHAEAGADAWRSAAGALRFGAADHSAMYAVCGETVETLHAIADLAAQLAHQVARYGDDRVLRDDQPGHDPADRLVVAFSWAVQLQQDLAYAERAANQLWSEIGHIAVEDVIA